jgi:hypothetical protein
LLFDSQGQLWRTELLICALRRERQIDRDGRMIGKAQIESLIQRLHGAWKLRTQNTVRCAGGRLEKEPVETVPVTVTPRGRLDFERKQAAVPPEPPSAAKKSRRMSRTALNIY